MRIITFTSAWGDYLKYYYDLALPSIMPSVQRLREEGHIVDLKLYERSEKLPRFPDCICHDFIDCMAQCIKQDAYLFLLMPDTLYGAETLYYAAKYAEHRNIYVGWAHYRFIAEDVLRAGIKLPQSNIDLMNALWPYPHKSTVDSDIDLPENSAHTRQSSRMVGEFTLVNHGYPTIYLFKPDGGDVQNWHHKRPNAHASTPKNWIWYDTGFFQHCVETKRTRLIGSADVAFCGELEPRDSHISACTTRNYDDRVPRRGDYSDAMLMTAYVYPRRLH